MPLIVRAHLDAVVISVVVALFIGACAPESAWQRCQHYDAAALTPENNFAAVVQVSSFPPIDEASEGIDLSLSVVRPLRGPITLVHVVGEREADRWDLAIPDGDPLAARCFISTAPGLSTCRAIIQTQPLAPGGYYYLLSNANTVLEAGLAFRLCR